MTFRTNHANLRFADAVAVVSTANSNISGSNTKLVALSVSNRSTSPRLTNKTSCTPHFSTHEKARLYREYNVFFQPEEIVAGIGRWRKRRCFNFTWTICFQRHDGGNEERLDSTQMLLQLRRLYTSLETAPFHRLPRKVSIDWRCNMHNQI